MNLSLIAAIDKKGAIGKDNRLLWHLPNDLKWFKHCTLAKPIIMGRKTYESIGRPLPKRLNIVVSRQSNLMIPEVEVVHSLEEALICAQKNMPLAEECVVIGGGDIYAQALASAKTLYITHVETEADATVFFPTIDWSQWRCEHKEVHHQDAKHAFDYTFCIYKPAY